MTAETLLVIFLTIRLCEEGFTSWLAHLNRKYYRTQQNQELACQQLGISQADLEKTLSYSEDKYRFGRLSTWINFIVFALFLYFGGLGYVETQSKNISETFAAGNSIVTGLTFFGILGLLSMVFSLPFSYYSTFYIEEKHGFNRQTLKQFVTDLIKGLVLGAVLGGLILGILLWIVEVMGSKWWLYAWGAVTVFSLLTMWIYPTILAPLFNKFKPLEEGELKTAINQLAEKVGFNAGGISVMDASIRSAHGNAYFTGVFGKKKIVLFDTLIQAMTSSQVVAVLAHELGHFKLHHIRWSLIRSTIMTGVMFYLFSLCIPLEVFYRAFHLQGVSYYGAFLTFSLWFGIATVILQPISTYLSRRNEFAADRFALKYIGDQLELARALLKLREKSQVMPISHPLYSAFYYSHPPMLERLKAMGWVKA